MGVSMKRLLFRVENISSTICSSNSNCAIKWYSDRQTPLTKNEKEPDDKTLNNAYIKGKRKVKETLRTIQDEWQRTEFFKEGGKHAENHNIRPQQEYVISKKVLFMILVTSIVTIAFNMYQDDLSNTNAYLKLLKEKKSASTDINDK